MSKSTSLPTLIFGGPTLAAFHLFSVRGVLPSIWASRAAVTYFRPAISITPFSASAWRLLATRWREDHGRTRRVPR